MEAEHPVLTVKNITVKPDPSYLAVVVFHNMLQPQEKKHITDTALTISSKVIALLTRHLPVCAAYKLEQVQSHSQEVVRWLSEEMLQLSI